jgi:phenylacetic acid degradation protein paaN
VLAEHGYDPNLVTLVVERPDEKLAATLAVRPEVKIIDYTGSTGFGNWLEEHARQAVVYTEKAGVNTVIVDSTDDFAGMCRNIAFSLTLYSGQMCTTPQNILVPRDGIDTGSGHLSFDEVARGIADAVQALVGDDTRAVELTGAIVNDAIPERIDRARELGGVLLDSREVEHPNYSDAVVRTPLILTADAADAEAIDREWFGPISFVVATDSTTDSIALFTRIVGAKGALTAAVYSTSRTVLAAVEAATLDVGVHLSANLTGAVFVNQSAAFSDFHGSGANAATNAALTDGAFVASRFRIVQSRRHI